jgi:hypothetical protein
MKEISSSITYEVNVGETVPMMVARSTRLTVQGAGVWVTRSNDVEDYLLDPGDCLRLRRGERLWLSVEGDRPAYVAFAVAPRPRDGLRDWLVDFAGRFGLRVRAGWRTV